MKLLFERPIMSSLKLLLVTLVLLSTLQTTASKVIVTTMQKNLEVEACPGIEYIEYHSSSGLPVILSAPHGGLLEPKEIPNRDAGCWNGTNCIWNHECGIKNFTKCKAITETDIYTSDLTTELYTVLCELFHGACPGVVINLLDRDKFDANRDCDEATFGVPEVVEAFNVYHCLIEREQSRSGGRGIFIDIHGHGHKLQRAELGYLVSGKILDNGTEIDPNKTSIRSLAARSGVHFDRLLRGSVSFGAFLELYGFESVPSPLNPGPGAGNIYFNGGYNTRRHGSLNGGEFDAVQIESPRTFRELPLRHQYALALGCTIKKYICLYYWNDRADTGHNRAANGYEDSEHIRTTCAEQHHDNCNSLSGGVKCYVNKTFLLAFVGFYMLVLLIRSV